MSEPTVSVITRTQGDRNHWLEQALVSVAKQSHPVESIIVLDHACRLSPVHAGHAFKEIQKLADKVFMGTNAPHRARVVMSTGVGEADASNTGVKASKGDLIAFLDDDDVMRPWHIERLVNAFMDQPTVAAAYCDVVVQRCDEDNHPLPGQSSVYEGPFTFEELKQENRKPNNAFLFRRVLLECNRFDSAAEPVDDWDCWLRVFSQTRGFYVPGVGASYKIRPNKSQFTTRDPDLLRRKTEEVRARYSNVRGA